MFTLLRYVFTSGKSYNNEYLFSFREYRRLRVNENDVDVDGV